MKSEETLFVWRLLNTEVTGIKHDVDDGYTSECIKEYESDFFTLDILINSKLRCKYCNKNLKTNPEYSSLMLFEQGWSEFCKFCGYFYHHKSTGTSESYHQTILKSFDLNSSHLAFEEIGKYLKHNINKSNRMTPRRFEQLIGDIYKQLGYKVEITQQTRDGGKDLILLNNQNEQIIVEVKRYGNSIGVEQVRKLFGVQLINNYTKSILVTNSHFSSYAIEESKSIEASSRGFTMDLVDSEVLLRLLNVYTNNKSLPMEINRRLNEQNSR